ncbi:MAG: DNA-binding response regulator [Chloroflexi bacterium RBG_16_54_11]|nr:MAG: DNA-binding response regulator [Chloroflexi bacterium RBG_16_54_11]
MATPKRQSKILIVDDEPRVINLVREVLNATGFEVIAAFSGESAIEMAAMEQPDLILLDIILPGTMDGYQVAKRLHEFSDVPIIMLTAKVREVDMLHGFEVGADDYITKPFSSKELLARVQAVLKRSKGEKTPKSNAEIVCGDLIIDFARRVVWVGDREIYLTPTEYNLLYELATHPNQVLFHDYLLTKVWGAEYRDDVDYLRSYIHYLRKKLEIDSSNPKLIISSPGVGYMLEVPDETNPSQ